VSVDGDAKAEVVRLRKLFSVPEIQIGNVVATGGAAGSLLFNGQLVSTTSTTAAEVRGVGARRSEGDPAGGAPPSGERLVRARARLAKMRADEAVETPDESAEETEILDEILDELDAAEVGNAEAGASAPADPPAGDPEPDAASAPDPQLRARLLATRAGCAAVLAQVRSASGSPSSATKSTTPV
jgi:hypothetical protein